MSAMSDLDITLDEMATAYAVCALWSSYDCTGASDEPLDDSHDVDDLTTGTRDEFRQDCADFLESNHADCVEMMSRGFVASQIGHDFWLTRNGHGAGFWDRGLGELGDRLADAARVYGSVDLWVTADGEVSS